MNQKQRPKSILSLFVVLVFTVTTIGADALPALAGQSQFSEVHPGIFLGTPLTLPAELGTVEAFHFGAGGGPLRRLRKSGKQTKTLKGKRGGLQKQRTSKNSSESWTARAKSVIFHQSVSGYGILPTSFELVTSN
ncbi:MAG: hypothetical protein HYU34_02650, partial [Candidatus Omnitrophica bacterium]|nr:hypothetical protein [Candidatus Omnitrophota bacterium]